MKLAQTFAQAIQDPNNWYEHNGMPAVNWNFIDADCYMACANDYPTADAFYDEWNALCEIYERTIATDRLQIKVDKAVA
jgi:hypothetical protein